MKKLLNKLFGLFELKEHKPQIPEKTKSKHGEKLTAWEKYFIWKQLKEDDTITCPNCEQEKMIEGASGGMSVNIRCPRCGQGVNFMIKPNTFDCSALDWCDNIGIDENWVWDEYKKQIV